MRARTPPRGPWPLALSTIQLDVILLAGGGLPPEKRGIFWMRVSERVRGLRCISDIDVNRAIRTALVVCEAPAER